MSIENELKKLELSVNKYKSSAAKKESIRQQEYEKALQEKKIVLGLMKKIEKVENDAYIHAGFFERIKINGQLRALKKELKNKYPEGYREYKYEKKYEEMEKNKSHEYEKQYPNFPSGPCITPNYP